MHLALVVRTLAVVREMALAAVVAVMLVIVAVVVVRGHQVEVTGYRLRCG